MTTLSLQVSSGPDDAHENNNNGGFTYTDNIRVRMTDATSSTSAFRGGFRFQNVTIPPGSTINSAVFVPYVQASDDPSCEIHAEDIDDSPSFETNQDVTGRTVTTAFSDWLGDNIGGGRKNSPDIAAVIQEVIDRPGWASGNALSIITVPKLAQTHAFTCGVYDADPTQSAQLEIDYTAPTPPPDTPWDFVASVSLTPNGTSEEIDTTGAKLIVAFIADDTAASSFADSKGNNWLLAEGTSGHPRTEGRVLYCINPTVGPGHTFTSGDGDFPNIDIIAVTCPGTPQLDDVNSNTAESASNLQGGPVTPSAGPAAIFSGAGFDNGTAGIVDDDPGFTVDYSDGGAGGVAWGCAFAYFFQESPAAVDPEWSNGASAMNVVVNVSFIEVSDPEPPSGGDTVDGIQSEALSLALIAGETAGVPVDDFYALNKIKLLYPTLDISNRRTKNDIYADLVVLLGGTRPAYPNFMSVETILAQAVALL